MGDKTITYTYQFTNGCNILHRLQVQHLYLTFIRHNNVCSNTIFIYIDIFCSNDNAFYYIDRINIRYKLLFTYFMKEADKS